VPDACVSLLDQTITVRKMLYALLKRLLSDGSNRKTLEKRDSA
jgi:hypothetical protein